MSRLGDALATLDKIAAWDDPATTLAGTDEPGATGLARECLVRIRGGDGRPSPPGVIRVEGVPYTPFLIRFSTTDGRRRTSTLWSPGQPFLSSEVNRYLEARGDVDKSKRILVRSKNLHKETKS